MQWGILSPPETDPGCPPRPGFRRGPLPLQGFRITLPLTPLPETNLPWVTLPGAIAPESTAPSVSNEVVSHRGETWRWKSWLTNQSTYGQWLWVMATDTNGRKEFPLQGGWAHPKTSRGIWEWNHCFFKTKRAGRGDSGISLGYLPVEVLCTRPTGRSTRGRPRTHWRH